MDKVFKFKEGIMRVPCFIWSEEGGVEQKAIDQIKNASSLPFAFHHTMLCRDGHFGYGAPIGGVMASKGYIIPNFVGKDIGCGMIACKTNIMGLDVEVLKKIMGLIRERIPVGFSHQKETQDQNLMPKPSISPLDYEIIRREYPSALKQLGTLGGGNHFIEIQKDNDGYIWIMIHSGSRNIGSKVADYYNKVAVDLNAKWHSGVPKEWELAFLPIDSQEGHNYFNEMKYCVDFALANRKLMMERVQECFIEAIGIPGNTLDGQTAVRFVDPINIAHNYAAFENHFGENVIVHRKGATLVREGTIGIIPGSQGTHSYIVKGKGNEDSYMSCSHGAGRWMGRNDAKRLLNLEEEIKKMNDLGIVHGLRTKDDLEEASSAYKDIDLVMANQQDLVEIVTELSPLGVIKG
jgi:tRNA-splicing ligase RtcB